MINLSPVWIISLLPEDEHGNFQELVNKQFVAFTENELTLPVSDEFPANKWWGVDNPESIFYANQLPLSLTQAYPGDAKRVFTSNRMTVIFVSRLNRSIDEFAKCKQLSDTIKSNLPKKEFNILYYAIFIQDKEFKPQSIDLLKPIFNANDNFSAIVLQNDGNINANNSEGFLSLKKISTETGRNETMSLACQTAFNIALGHDKLYGDVQNNQNVFVSGGFSLVFENEVAKSKLAKKYISVPMLDAFLNNEKDSCWLDSRIIPATFEGNLKKINANDYYGATVMLFDNDFKNVMKFFSHGVSPWSLLSYTLIPKYFKHELKNIPQKLIDFGYLLDLKFLELYRKHLQNALFSDEGLQKRSISNLYELANSLWVECDPDKNTPVGIKQFLHNLYLIKEQIISEQNALLDPTEFDKICFEKEPIKVPPLIYGEYKKLVTSYSHGTSDKDISDAEKDKDGEEAGYIKKLVRTLKIHPIPLSLLVRAGLLGLVLSIVSLTMLKYWVPDFLVNTSFFEKGSGVYIWLTCAFAAPILGAFLFYLLGVLREIRRLKKKYLAWVFYKVQRKLIKETQEKINNLFEHLLSECIRIENNLKVFLKKDETADITELKTDLEMLNNLIPCKEYRYPVNYFQQSIIEPIDMSSELCFTTDFNESNYFLNTSQNQRININCLSVADLYRVFCKSFIEQKLFQKFFSDALLEQKMSLPEFIEEIQKNNEALVESEKKSIDDFSYSHDAKKAVMSRSQPSFYDYASSNINKFAYIIAQDGSIPETLAFMKPVSDGSIKLIVITGDSIHPAPLSGFRQHCEFYRLSSEKDLTIE